VHASLRKGLMKERESVSEQLMRFGPMSCEGFGPCVCVCVCVHVDLVEDVVNWLRFTCSGGDRQGYGRLHECVANTAIQSLCV